MTLYVKVSGSWRTVSSQWTKVSGSWRSVPNVYAKVSGSWRTADVPKLPTPSISTGGGSTATFTINNRGSNQVRWQYAIDRGHKHGWGGLQYNTGNSASRDETNSHSSLHVTTRDFCDYGNTSTTLRAMFPAQNGYLASNWSGYVSRSDTKNESCSSCSSCSCC